MHQNSSVAANTISFSTSLGCFDELEDKSLFQKYLALRKLVFVDKMGWQGLTDAGDVELDEYDHSQAIYVICHDTSGNVLGGARLLQTNQESTVSAFSEHPTSYMIRDAALGRLEELPSELCDREPPQDPNVIELTRLIAEQPGVAAEILKTVNTYMVQRKQQSCLFLGRPSFMRMASMMGFDPKPLGPVQGNASGRFVAFSCNALPMTSIGV
jgi:acyl homoserine lactone synthase